MKKITAIFFALIFSSAFIFAQNQDALIRASYASYYLEEVQEDNYIFNTPFGEATANIILKAYRDLQPIPKISFENMNFSDKSKVEKIISSLNQLSKNPPSWDEIVKLEKQHLIRWDKAVRLKSKYNSIE